MINREINGIKFTQREADIIAFMLSGRSAKKTASLLSLTPKTVETHVYRIMGKLSCRTRDSVIDFIEKSGKSLVFRHHYSNIIGLAC